MLLAHTAKIERRKLRAGHAEDRTEEKKNRVNFIEKAEMVSAKTPSGAAGTCVGWASIRQWLDEEISILHRVVVVLQRDRACGGEGEYRAAEASADAADICADCPGSLASGRERAKQRGFHGVVRASGRLVRRAKAITANASRAPAG